MQKFEFFHLNFIWYLEIVFLIFYFKRLKAKARPTSYFPKIISLGLTFLIQNPFLYSLYYFIKT